MDILQRLTQHVPFVTRHLLNLYAPFRGAGITIDRLDLDGGQIQVSMPLTRKNRNIVGVHFGGSLYAMVDPFYMLILMHQLGEGYIVWDKAASINFLTPGRSTVSANIRISATEVDDIRRLAASNEPVLRTYQLDIVDDQGQRIAAVEKVVYIRRKKPKASRSVASTA